MARLTDEERRQLYQNLLAKKQGRSGTEVGNMLGGIGRGLARIAAAGTNVDVSDVGQSAAAIGAARDQAESDQAARWRQLLGEDRRDRSDELAQKNIEFNQDITREQQDRLKRQAEEDAKQREFTKKITLGQQARLTQEAEEARKQREYRRDITEREQARLEAANASTLETQALNRDIAKRKEARLAEAAAWARNPNNPANQPKADLSVEDKTQISTLARSTANKKAIVNQLEAAGDKFDAALNAGDQDLAVTLGRQMLKTLNSTEGADAVGAEEAKRLGGLLEYKIGNLFEPGSFIGRDLGMFGDQIRATREGIEDAVRANEEEIQKLRGQGSAAAPKTIQYQGKTYSVDENGNMTEVQ